MTKTDFIQHVLIRNCPALEEADAAIGYAQLLWDKLAARGYGQDAQKTSAETVIPAGIAGIQTAGTPEKSPVGFVSQNQPKTAAEQRYKLLSEINGLKILLQDKIKPPETLAALQQQLEKLEQQLAGEK